jgi:hypothetical protein
MIEAVSTRMMQGIALPPVVAHELGSLAAQEARH